MGSKKGHIDKSMLDEPKDVMEKLHLMNGSYLTNAAMLLFSKAPDKWQPNTYAKIGFFETDVDLLYQDEVHDSVLEQIEKICSACEKDGVPQPVYTINPGDIMIGFTAPGG